LKKLIYTASLETPDLTIVRLHPTTIPALYAFANIRWQIAA
jgi:hypothetical protein